MHFRRKWTERNRSLLHAFRERPVRRFRRAPGRHAVGKTSKQHREEFGISGPRSSGRRPRRKDDESSFAALRLSTTPLRGHRLRHRCPRRMEAQRIEGKHLDENHTILYALSAEILRRLEPANKANYWVDKKIISVFFSVK